jgi:hypothetical protein
MASGAIIFIREADRAEAETWSIKMEGYGGPSRLRSSPPPTNFSHAMSIEIWRRSSPRLPSV